MSGRVVQTYHDTDTETRDPMNPYQSAWMCSNLATLEHDHVALGDESKGDDWDHKQALALAPIVEHRKAEALPVDEVPCDTSGYRNKRGYPGDLAIEKSDVSVSVKAIGGIAKTRRVTYTNETLVMNSENLTNVRSELLHPFPMFNINQNIASILAPKANLGVYGTHLSRFSNDDIFEHGSANVGTSKRHFPSRVLKIVSNEAKFLEEYCSQPERVSEALELSVTPQIPLERNGFPVSRPFQEDLTGSNFNLVQQGFKSRGTPVPSVMSRKKETHPSSSYAQSKEYFAKASSAHMERDCSYHIYSASLLCDSTMDNQLISQNPGSIYSGENNAFEQLHDPSTSHLSFPISVGEQGKRMDVSPYSGLLCGQPNAPEVSKLEESNHGYCSLFRAPTCPAHNVETVRTCTTVDCLEGVPGGQSKISQTTHHMLITKKSGVNISVEDQMIRKSTVCTESRGNALTELLGLLPDFDYHVKHRVELSSKDNQGKEGAGDQTGSLGTNNESSADTDIMDTKVCQARNYFLGIDSSPSAKDVMVGQIPAKYQVVSPSREVGRRKREIELPDMNQMPPCSASESAMENMGFSTSRTESLDMERLHSQVVHVEKLTCNPQQKSPPELDPSSRWEKRIKLISASGSLAHGNSRSEDASYTENISTLLNKNMDNRGTTTEPTSSNHLGKKQMELGKNMMLSRSREPSSKVSEKEQRDLNLSHSWIRRWCRNVADASTIKPSGEPQRSNAALDALERKQPPSIAAMALMGKAMSGFQTCEFKNKGSFVVWSSGEL